MERVAMIEQFTAFRASDGTTHDSAYAAWKRELRCWLRTNGVDNDAIADAIVKKVDDGRMETLNGLEVIVAGLIEHAPEPPAKADPETTSNSADWAPETRHARDCAYVTTDGPAPCTCHAAEALIA
jgi:hypothetical protein